LEIVCTVEVEGGTGSTAERGESNAISGPFWKRSTGSIGFNMECHPDFHVGAETQYGAKAVVVENLALAILLQVGLLATHLSTVSMVK
jgi:hypothetical protein